MSGGPWWGGAGVGAGASAGASAGGGEMCHRGQTEKLRGQILWLPEPWELRSGWGSGEWGVAGWKESWAAANWHAVTGLEASLSRNMHEKHMSKHCYTEPTKTHVSSFTEHVVHAGARTCAHTQARSHSHMITHPSMLDVTSKKKKQPANMPSLQFSE